MCWWESGISVSAPKKFGKNIVSFLESLSDVSDEEEERKPPAKSRHDGQVDNVHIEINVENKKSRQMYHNNKILMEKKLKTSNIEKNNDVFLLDNFIKGFYTKNHHIF